MRLPRSNVRRILIVGLSFLTGCAAVSPKPAPTPLDLYQQAYDQGRALFNRELAEGDPNVEIYGNDQSPGLDEETGLPRVTVPSTDMDDVTSGRVSGHNDALHEYIDQYGLPADSRKKWQKELFHLADYFEQRSHEETASHLACGTGHEVSPDGKYTLMLREASADTRPGSPGPELVLFNQSTEQGVPLPAGAGDRADVSFVWGPPGSDTAIFRFKSAAGAPLLVALDLRTGKWLREEATSAPDRLTRSGD